MWVGHCVEMVLLHLPRKWIVPLGVVERHCVRFMLSRLCCDSSNDCGLPVGSVEFSQNGAVWWPLPSCLASGRWQMNTSGCSCHIPAADMIRGWIYCSSGIGIPPSPCATLKLRAH